MQEFTGKTVELAIEAAIKTLGVSQEALNIDIIDEGSKGFLGLGKKEARIAVSLKETASSKGEVVSEFEPKTNLNSSPEVSAVSEEEAIDQRAMQDVAEEIEKVEEIEEVDNEAPRREEEVMADEQEGPLASVSEPTESVISNLDKGASQPHFAFDDEAADDEEEEDAWGGELTIDVDFPARYLIDVCAAYGVDVTVEVEDLGRQIIYHINTDKPGLVIGKHGKIINALETLARILTHRYVRNRVQVMVNVGNYRERRLKTLAQLAERKADEVLNKKISIALEPLPARERKIVHQALSQYDNIKTHSEGREPHRYLVISYAGHFNKDF